MRALALQRQLVERRLRGVMEVEEERAAVAMELPARALMLVMGLGMQEMRVLLVSLPREEMREDPHGWAARRYRLRGGAPSAGARRCRAALTRRARAAQDGRGSPCALP